MGDAEAVAEELRLRPRPAELRRVVHGRYRDRDYYVRRALLVADVLGLWTALVVAMALVGGRAMTLSDSLWLLPTLPAWALLFWTYMLYRRSIRRFEPTHIGDLASLFHALIVGTLGLWLFYKYLAPVPQLAFAEVLVFGLVALPLIAALRAVLRTACLRLQGPERIFAIAAAADVELLRRKLRNHPELGMELAGAVSGEGICEPGLSLQSDLEDVEALIASRQVDHVLVRLDDYLSQLQVRDLMHACHREGVRFGCFPAVKELLLPGTELNHLEGMGVLTSDPPVFSRTARAMKRCLDIGVSALALALLSPLLTLVALAVRLDSKGPAFYRQLRVGRDGNRFRLLKFRTMVVGADSMDEALMRHSVDPDWLVMDDDPRVTRLGRFLRRYSVDELPQLWNVLRGQMSLVGPRPLPERDDEKVHGRQRHRLDLTPGITGYWQVLGRNDIPFREMLEIDYAYIASWSMWGDIQLLAQTVPVVLRRRGSN